MKIGCSMPYLADPGELFFLLLYSTSVFSLNQLKLRRIEEQALTGRGG